VAFYPHVETDVLPALEVLVPSVPKTLASQLDPNKNDFLVSLVVDDNGNQLFQVACSQLFWIGVWMGHGHDLFGDDCGCAGDYYFDDGLPGLEAVVAVEAQPFDAPYVGMFAPGWDQTLLTSFWLNHERRRLWHYWSDLIWT